LSYDDPLDKDRLYFTQNNSPIRTRCPECVRIMKILRHCRIFKNLPSLWWHIKHEHGKISNLLFNTDDIIKVLNAVSKAEEWGIIPEPTPIYVKPTTSSSLVYHRKKPRNDVYEKLEKIASFLINQSYSWPIFSLEQVRLAIKMSMKNPDKRTVRDYLDCIIDSSSKNSDDVTINVTQFCSEFESSL